MLCDLQGGFTDDGIILTDPVLMSQSKKYGPTDLGRKGIREFFNHHRCNQFCRHDEWLRPKLGMPSKARRGTTMSDSSGNVITTTLGMSTASGASTGGLGTVRGATVLAVVLGIMRPWCPTHRHWYVQ